MWKGGDFPLNLLDPNNPVERREEKREEEKRSKKLKLFSRISGDRVVGFHRSKRESSST